MHSYNYLNICIFWYMQREYISIHKYIKHFNCMPWGLLKRPKCTFYLLTAICVQWLSKGHFFFFVLIDWQTSASSASLCLANGVNAIHSDMTEHWPVVHHVSMDSHFSLYCHCSVLISIEIKRPAASWKHQRAMCQALMATSCKRKGLWQCPWKNTASILLAFICW